MWDQLWNAIASGQGASMTGAVVVVGIALSFLLRPTVARAQRPRLRMPALLLLAAAGIWGLLEFWSPSAGTRKLVRVIPMLLVLLAFGRLASVALFDWVLGRRLQREAPRIVRDIAEGVVAILAFLFALRAAGVEAVPLVATSAVITAVIGLSLQDTLGNLFAGLSLQAQQPFTVGEWIQLDKEGEQVGQVVEINWRATKLRTLDNTELVIPNGQLARATLVNCSRPTPALRRSVVLTIPYDFPTRMVHGVILRGVADLPGVCSEPPPSVVTRDFRDYGIQYWVRYFIEEFDRRDALDGMVRDRLWYALQRAGIPVATPHHRVLMHEWNADREQKADDRSLKTRSKAIRGLDFLRDLPDSAIEKLATDARTELYEAGEIVVRQGDKGEELFLCLRGELAVLHTPDAEGPRREIARLRAGGIFGELSLMTGEPRTATVQAEEACELVVIGKPVFSEILSENPTFAELISGRLAARLAELQAVDRHLPEPVRSSVEEQKGQLLRRVRQFFSL
jgi:small-conductance mechanosensitive channel